ncbi:hypothetical protein [Aureibacter tunicatorum]|uniref:RiboL-PSP-HEPN domain-containing protein n=1 Tax=Aureibacter tunicatorum TaxID=866807 RepID=A0AAE3XK66_9BACT|nr:hypothetical protein [Aureibacter tunicatorum]MDR6237420.1 hypothetical protein [Aureibacter tunicatorum]
MTFATWELFLKELERNIHPKKEEIKDKYLFLLENEICDEDTFEKLISIRYMAAYEQALNEYLHPPFEWEQSNIKSEIFHFGTLAEALLEMFIHELVKRRKLSLVEIKKHAKKYPDDQHLTFSQLIGIIKDFKNKMLLISSNKDDVKYLGELVVVLNALRIERNKIHLNQILPTKDGEAFHEEFRLMNIRNHISDLPKRFMNLLEI